MNSLDGAEGDVDMRSTPTEEAPVSTQVPSPDEHVVDADAVVHVVAGEGPATPEKEANEATIATASPDNAKEVTEAETAKAANATATSPPPSTTPVSAADSKKKVVFAQHEASAQRQRSAHRAATAVTSSPPRVDVPPAAPSNSASVVGAPLPATNTDASDVYTRAEAERIAAAAAALTPTTVLGLFRRGGDNSHTNRMEAGSYSRYLLSTDHMPPMVLSETFHGEQPTLGTVPRNTAKSRASGEEEDDDAQQQQQQQYSYASSQRSVPAPLAVDHARRASSPSNTFSSNLGGPNNTIFNSTTGSGTLKREVDMLDAATFAGLDRTRLQRRHDPRKGKPAQPQLDHVYYNHKSKGFFIPHDPSPDTVMLQYNHLYDFGDGTRFAPLATSTRSGATEGGVRHNPHAAPPRTFADTRGCAFPLTASQRQRMTNSAPPSTSTRVQQTPHSTIGRGTSGTTDAVQQQQRRRQRAEIQKGTSSLRTAKALDLSRLHRTQCPRPRTIEEVLADQQRSYLSTAVPHPLVQDIRRDVDSGKLGWEEVPEIMQTALTAAATAAAQRSGYESAHTKHAYPREASAGQATRTASLSQPTNGLVDVMGHLRPVPAIAAATTSRSANATSPSMRADGTAMAADDIQHPSSQLQRSGGSEKGGSTGTASPLPAISRLNYTR